VLMASCAISRASAFHQLENLLIKGMDHIHPAALQLSEVARNHTGPVSAHSVMVRFRVELIGLVGGLKTRSRDRSTALCRHTSPNRARRQNRNTAK
jgi:hypothetical protein